MSTVAIKSDETSQQSHKMGAAEKRAVFGASLGTVFEWYDFLLFGTLASVLSQQFFSGVNPTAAFIFTLLSFSVGFAIRPLGSLVFGRMGDLLGRKITFLTTMIIMGLATFVIGLVPNYATIGIAAPIILICLRLLQGLAVGGEFGGAATYIAEFAPSHRRGEMTAWLQITPSAGVILSLLVVLICRSVMSPADFNDWGWRIPFLLSGVLLAVSLWIRLRLAESPVFNRLKAEGGASTSPIKDSFGNWNNVRYVLMAFALASGTAVVWSVGVFYTFFFLTQTLKLDAPTTNILLLVGLVITTPTIILFGILSDRIGRKPVIVAALALSVVLSYPIFQGFIYFGNPALQAAQKAAPVTVVADPAGCTVQFNPVGTSRFTTPCDVAKSALVARGIPYSNVPSTGPGVQIKVGPAVVESYDGATSDAATRTAFGTALDSALRAAQYPLAGAGNQPNMAAIFALWIVLMLIAAMGYAPTTVIITELFPSNIRYTSFSLPYSLGAIMAAFLTPVAFAIQAQTGSLTAGLWYALICIGIALVVVAICVRETRRASEEFAK